MDDAIPAGAKGKATKLREERIRRIAGIACSAYAKSGPHDRGALPLEFYMSALRVSYNEAGGLLGACVERGFLTRDEERPGTWMLSTSWRVRMIEYFGLEAEWARTMPFERPSEEVARTRDEASRPGAAQFEMFPATRAA